jgi:hypothetical protein
MSKKPKKERNKKFVPLEHNLMLLEGLFQHGPPVNNTTLKGGKPVGKLSDECFQYIAFRTHMRWKPSQIAEVLGVSSRAVNKSLRLFRSDANKFFDFRIVVRIESFDKRNPPSYLCRLHGEQFSVMADANNHCWFEVLNGEWA